MATDVITGEFKDLSSCHALTLSRGGRTALLSGKRLYGLVTIADTLTLNAKIARKSKHVLRDLKFSRLRDDLLAEASDHRLVLLSVASGSLLADPDQSPRLHSREISCLDWHPLQHNLIAAASLDRSVSVWDIREHFKRPCMKITNNSTFPSKVSWEKVDGNLLASCHDSQLKIWDKRRPSYPLLIHVNSEAELPVTDGDFQAARSRRIMDVDFNPVVRNLVATGSADSVVRVIRADCATNCADTVIIQMPQKRWPVTKVRQAPFGRALISLVADHCASEPGNQSMYHSRENNLTLWTSLANKRLESGAFVHTFYGHNDIVLDYHWLERVGDVGHHWQLITWSKDNTLKLWPLSENLLEMCGYDDEVIATTANDNNNIVETTPPPPYCSDDVIINDVFATAAATATDGGNSDSAVSMGHGNGYDSSSEDVSKSTDDFSMAESEPKMINVVSGDHHGGSARQSPLARSPNKRGLLRIPNLDQEFASVKFGDRVSIETLDTSKTPGGEPYAVVVGETNTHRVYFQAKFPPGYMFLTEPPRFSMITGTTLDQATGFRIQHKVQKEAERLTNAGERCLETCFQIFEQEIINIFRQEQEEIASISSKSKSKKQFLTGNDAVPFPRTSGARFCGLGQLVCFGWSYSVNVVDVSRRKDSPVPPRVAKTPRALSALMPAGVENSGSSGGGGGGGDLGDGGTGGLRRVDSWKRSKESFQISVRSGSKVSFDPRFISSAKVEEESSSMLGQFLLYRNRFSNSHNQDEDKGGAAGATASAVGVTNSEKKPDNDEAAAAEATRKFVTIYDALPMISFNRKLAEEYIVSGRKLSEVCRHNARVALKHRHPKAARTWQLAAKCCESRHSFNSGQFGHRNTSYPRPIVADSVQQMARNNGQSVISMVRTLFKRHASLWDWQTASVLCCVFAKATVGNMSGNGGHDLEAMATSSGLAGGHGKHGETRSESHMASQEHGARPSGGGRLHARRNRSECLQESRHSALDSASSDFGGIKQLFNQAESLAELKKHWELLDKDDDNTIGGGSGDVSDVYSVATARVLDPALTNYYDACMLFYAEMLRRCGLLIQAVEVTQLMGNHWDGSAATDKTAITHKCPKCETTGDFVCPKCNDLIGPKCVYCGLVVRGHACVCFTCGHGGHLLCMNEWFENSSVCPSGFCDCQCLEQNGFFCQ